MQIHGRAKLGPAGRLALTQAVMNGMALKQAAACFNVSPATAHRWWHRRLQATSEELVSGAWLLDRSSRPHRSPRLLEAPAQERICDARRHTGWGPRLVAGATGHPHSTVWKVLHRHGLSRRPRQPREAAHRYEWPCPGDLLHMDITRYARFERPGHALTGDRDKTGAEKRRLCGYEFAHAIIDDHSRLAYVELLPDERAATVVGVHRTRAGLVRRARHPRPARNDRQRLESTPATARLHALLAKAASDISRSAPPTADQRQDRALPPDHGPRVGLRPHLPLKHPPRPTPCHTGSTTTTSATPQRTRQPATHQPRSQPL